MNSVRVGVTVLWLGALAACDAKVSSNVPESPVQTELDAPPPAPELPSPAPAQNGDAARPETPTEPATPASAAPVKTDWERTASSLRFKSYREFCERQKRCVAVYDDEDLDDPEAELERLRCWSDLDVCTANKKPKLAELARGVAAKLRDGDHTIDVIQLGSDLAGTTRWRCALRIESGGATWLVPMESVCGGLVGPQSAADHRVLGLAWLPDRRGQAFWLRLEVLQKRWSAKGSPTPEQASFEPEYELVTVCSLDADGPICSAVVPVAFRSFDTGQVLRNELVPTPTGVEVKLAPGVDTWDMEYVFVGTLTPTTEAPPVDHEK